ncbi:MAG: creatinine amidohydrolase [Haloarculaceae archaeon]|jgi:creatinine amidohydrolase
MSVDVADSVLLADCSWRDIETAIADGVDTVIVPLGATEQHGPHLPVDTDTRLGTAIAVRVARRLGDALVAPTVPVGPSEEHLSFPGTISISADTARHLVSDVVDSLDRHGFDRVVLLPGHGGWFPLLASLYPTLARETACDLVAISELQWYMELLEDGLEQAGVDVDEPVVHAGVSETAMLLALDPESVEEDRPAGHSGHVSAAALFANGIEAYDENGVLGDPRPATAAVGETLLEHVTTAYTGYIREEFAALDGSGSE